MLSKPDYCRSCILYGNGQGYVPADGQGSNGVFVVLEAAGADEEAEGRPTVGRAGHYLWSQLARVGLERDDFRIHNVLSCRPPDNKLAKMPYEAAAIDHCSPLLDATIFDMQQRCKDAGKTFVILTLGRIAFKRVMGLSEKDPILKADYCCYPFRSEKYQATVLALDHPAFIMRGNHHLVPMMQYGFKRAVEIAANGLTLDNPYYLLDPTPARFDEWANEYFNVLEHATNGDAVYLSYDIETPHKQGMDEEKVAKEDDTDYTILRCSFCYTPGNAVSVPWQAQYIPTIQRLFASTAKKVGWNNTNYDDPRIKAQMPMNGDLLDAMMGWHVLNSALPKGLGFVAPFYWKNTEMWKHEAANKPSWYNAKDADAALRCWLGIKQSLKEHDLCRVFDRHITQVNRVFAYMSNKGVLLDLEMRAAAEKEVAAQLQNVQAKIQEVVPVDAKEKKVYKKEPKDTTGMVRVQGSVKVPICSRCGARRVTAAHFKSVGKKKLKLGLEENPCIEGSANREDVATELWAKVLEFKLSKVSLTRYQQVMGHKPIIDRQASRRGEIKTTFDEKAIIKLGQHYPKDPLYQLILTQRGASKLLGTYIGITQEDGSIRGGMATDLEGVIHTTLTRNPETLRSASSNPNMQNCPRD